MFCVQQGSVYFPKYEWGWLGNAGIFAYDFKSPRHASIVVRSSEKCINLYYG